MKDARAPHAIVDVYNSDIVNVVALSADGTLAVPAGLVAVQVAASAVEERGAELTVAR
jgi:hypothetical protein